MDVGTIIFIGTAGGFGLILLLYLMFRTGSNGPLQEPEHVTGVRNKAAKSRKPRVSEDESTDGASRASTDENYNAGILEELNEEIHEEESEKVLEKLNRVKSPRKYAASEEISQLPSSIVTKIEYQETGSLPGHKATTLKPFVNPETLRPSKSSTKTYRPPRSQRAATKKPNGSPLIDNELMNKFGATIGPTGKPSHARE